MRHSKLLILAAALLIMLELSGAALAEDTINNLWKSGNDFLFHTDNVTVNGDAIFTLDGNERASSIGNMRAKQNPVKGRVEIFRPKEVGKRNRRWPENTTRP